ncbi:LysR family transcriptional regulator, partial [Mycobacterium tuberculosis]
DLGVALFDRSRRNAQLSEAGQVLLLEARELLRQAEQLDQRARSLNAGNEAALSLALDEALPYTAIATLMREISVKFPSLELTLLNGTATEV